MKRQGKGGNVGYGSFLQRDPQQVPPRENILAAVPEGFENLIDHSGIFLESKSSSNRQSSSNSNSNSNSSSSSNASSSLFLPGISLTVDAKLLDSLNAEAANDRKMVIAKRKPKKLNRFQLFDVFNQENKSGESPPSLLPLSSSAQGAVFTSSASMASLLSSSSLARAAVSTSSASISTSQIVEIKPLTQDEKENLHFSINNLKELMPNLKGELNPNLEMEWHIESKEVLATPHFKDIAVGLDLMQKLMDAFSNVKKLETLIGRLKKFRDGMPLTVTGVGTSAGYYLVLNNVTSAIIQSLQTYYSQIFINISLPAPPMASLGKTGLR